MAEPVKLLVSGLPAEIVREIGLRLRGVTVTEFENTQQMGRAASQGNAALVFLSDTLPAQDSIYIARRAKDASDDVRIAYSISMAQAEAALHALKEIKVDRFFLSPVDNEEMLRELAKMCKVEVLPPQASHGANIAAAILDAWDRTRGPVFKKIDALDDAAIALLDNSLSPGLKSQGARGAQNFVELADRFGFPRASRIAREIADKFSAESLTVDGVRSPSSSLRCAPRSRDCRSRRRLRILRATNTPSLRSAQTMGRTIPPSGAPRFSSSTTSSRYHAD